MARSRHPLKATRRPLLTHSGLSRLDLAMAEIVVESNFDACCAASLLNLSLLEKDEPAPARLQRTPSTNTGFVETGIAFASTRRVAPETLVSTTAAEVAARLAVRSLSAHRTTPGPVLRENRNAVMPCPCRFISRKFSVAFTLRIVGGSSPVRPGSASQELRPPFKLPCLGQARYFSLVAQLRE